MNHPYFTQSSLEFMFYDYERKNVMMILLYLIVTLGLYIIPWIYFHNKKFEEIDEKAPDSKRGAVILFLLPVLTYSLFLVLKTIFFPESLELEILEIVLWGLVIFLTLKYIYEFCYSFARITNTKTLPWYLLIYVGYSSFILALFGFHQALYVGVIFFIGIISMQEAINVMCFKVMSKKEKDSFNYMKRSESNY